MSRHTHITPSGREIAYGFDTFGGYFIQVYLLEDEKDDENDELAYELSSSPIFISKFKSDATDKHMKVGYSNGEILKEMEFWELPTDHIMAVASDIPF